MSTKSPPGKPVFGQPEPKKCERCGFEWRAGAITQMWKRDELGRAICRHTVACDARAPVVSKRSSTDA
jgi:hypothetical protein